MLTQHVLRAGEMAHADDHDLAQPAVEARFPSHRVGVVEPALRQRWRVEQHAIDVDQLAAPSGAIFLDDLGEFWMVLLLNQGNAGHELPFPLASWPGLSRPDRCCCPSPLTSSPRSSHAVPASPQA